MLGITSHDKTVPREEPLDDAESGASPGLDGLSEMLGGPAADSELVPSEHFSIDGPTLHDLPTVLADPDAGPGFDVSRANVDMPENESGILSPPMMPAVPHSGPRTDPSEQFRITDLVKQITGNIDASEALNEAGPPDTDAALDEIRSLYNQIPDWPFAPEDSRPVAPPIIVGREPIEPSGTIELLPYRPSEDDARPEMLVEASPGRHSENQSQSVTDSAPAFPATTRSNDSESDGSTRTSAALPPWPILIVDLEHPDQLIRAEMDVLAGEVEQLAGDIAQKRIDDYAYRQFAERRALYWDR
jgi:hypothetical protein